MAISTRPSQRKLTGGYSQPVYITGQDIDLEAAITGNVEVIQPVHNDLNANVNIQVADIDVGLTNPVPITDTWTPALTSDEAANDSDKTIAVTAGQAWHLLWLWVELASTATAGNRQIVVEFQDAANDVVGQLRAGAVQAASLTYYYMFAPALADLTALRDTDYLMTPMPPTMILNAGYQIRVYDNNAVDAAADDMVLQLGYAYKTV